MIDGIPDRPLYFYQKDIIDFDGLPIIKSGLKPHEVSEDILIYVTLVGWTSPHQLVRYFYILP